MPRGIDTLSRSDSVMVDRNGVIFVGRLSIHNYYQCTTHRGNGNSRNGAGGFFFLYTSFGWGRVRTDLEDVQRSCLVGGCGGTI